MRLMMAYFAAFDGVRTWGDDLEGVVDATFHGDLRVEEDGQTLDRPAFKDKLRSFVESGGSMEIVKIKQQPLGIHYELTFHKPSSGDDEDKATAGPSFTTKSFATFRDGKLVRVQRDRVRRPNNIL